ncbi:MAG: tetratricopeptide repeat protein [Clostridium sp.]|nr:tetratricopeptide repeat protein [Clostridium sp.]
MANKHHEEETHTAIDDLNDSLTGIGQKVQKNSKILVYCCVALAAIVAIVLIYVYAVRMPGIKKANDAIGEADLTLVMGNDSLALEQYKKIAEDYGYAAGNRANLQAAMLLYQEGKYEEALEYAKKYDPSEEIIGASAISLQGDCYVNLKQYDQALSCFKKAVSQSDNNPYYTPVFMIKEANVYRELKDYKAEAALYREIIEKYPTYGDQISVDLEKYLRRAELQAGQE